MRMRNLFHLRQRICMWASTCALALGAPLAHAETAEGTLEHGAGFSALWFVSPESGDLVGHLFHNARPLGKPSWPTACLACTARWQAWP